MDLLFWGLALLTIGYCLFARIFAIWVWGSLASAVWVGFTLCCLLVSFRFGLGSLVCFAVCCYCTDESWVVPNCFACVCL